MSYLGLKKRNVNVNEDKRKQSKVNNITATEKTKVNERKRRGEAKKCVTRERKTE